MSSLANKVALITGSAKGLGRAFGEYLLKKGSKVVLSDVDTERGQLTHNDLKNQYGDLVSFQKCDVSLKEDIESLFAETKAKFGNIDIVCNNAGILHEGQWRQMVDINLTAMIHGTQLGIDYMSTAKGGRGGVIVNVASAAGLEIVPFGPVYSATKTGIVAYSRSIAGHNMTTKGSVRVNCLCPTFTDTDIMKITKEQVLGLGLAQSTVASIGRVLPLDPVVAGFAKLVEDESLHGEALRISPKGEKFESKI